MDTIQPLAFKSLKSGPEQALAVKKYCVIFDA